MPEDVLVGVDLGGTRIRLVASGSKGKTRPISWSRRVEALAPGLADLPRFLQRLWRRWDVSRGGVDALVVASRGIWTPGDRRALRARLQGLAKRVEVMSDAEAAFLGALGERPGILLLAGTGSIVLGRSREGRWARAGGLGPLLGDEGSAFWIGRSWLRATSRGENLARARKTRHSPDAVSQVAALAPSVLRRAARGHPAARMIVADSQELLAVLACQVARDLRLSNPVPVSWAGSLLENRAFRAGLWRALRRLGITPRVVRPTHSPVVAAHLIASRLARRAISSGSSTRT